MKTKLFILLCFLTFASCTSNTNNSTTIIDQELHTKALQEGNRISSLAQQSLGSRLMKSLKENGPENTVAFCKVSAYPILDSLNVVLNVQIKRAAIKARNPQDLPTDYEKEIIETYNQAINENAKLEPLVQVLDENEVLYAAPIKTKNDMCLKCHGSVDNEINASTYKKIQSLYPTDKAINHQVGDLRGIWSIRFLKDELESYQPDLALSGIEFLQQNCYNCHNPKAASHDDVIAPPMEAVKRRYFARHETKEVIKTKMLSFLKEPNEAKAIMRGPVRRFGLMPKFQWSEENMEMVVDYIMSNKLEQPEWFEAHYNERHGDVEKQD